MQPYFMPYLGYFQLMNAVDEFVIYDNIEYTKKGWINRNRILLNGKESLFTIPIKKDSDYLTIRERSLSENALNEIKKILNKIRLSYAKAPYFNNIFPLVEYIFLNDSKSLFDYILNSVIEIKRHLGILSKLIISSNLKIDHSLKGKSKVIGICKELNANLYINPIGGISLYNKDEFKENGIILSFHKMNEIEYSQQMPSFEQALSIIDVMMFNSQDHVRELLEEYSLL
jgi:WbqC-like protein family